MIKSGEIYTIKRNRTKQGEKLKMQSEAKINIRSESTIISNMLKTMKIREQTHRDLKVYAAEHGFGSLGEAIDALLKEHKDKSLATERGE